MEEAQAKLGAAMKEKEQIEKELERRDEEIGGYELLMGEKQVHFEREQLKLLTYRKEEMLDLLHSLREMTNVANAKKKTECLEQELLKIDCELFELEKKYGEFKIHKLSTPTP